MVPLTVRVASTNTVWKGGNNERETQFLIKGVVVYLVAILNVWGH